jgi:hypothetical protein
MGMGTKKGKTTTCCYCKRKFAGKVHYQVPPGAHDRKHDGKPLCDGCGGRVPHEELIQRLDAEELAKSVR